MEDGNDDDNGNDGNRGNAGWTADFGTNAMEDGFGPQFSHGIRLATKFPN